MRVKAVIAYDGGFFHGFQKQTKTAQTVMGQLEKALSILHITSAIVGSGRTDAGVHATGQVIHFDLPDFWRNLSKLTTELNRKLLHIRIKHITAVEADFHARFSAKKRLYRYVFKQMQPSLFEENHVAHFPSFDNTLLREALALFEGKHDFALFLKTGTVTHTTVREIYRTAYKIRGDYHLLYFEANGFLRAQVRMMVEAAMLCAMGKMSLIQLQEQIDTKHRHSTRLAPPEGLYLARILY